MATSKVTLKLLVNKSERKVLFAEANKEFVDFLFYVLSLPFGSIVKLVKEKNMVGCLGELYQSIETLSETYMLSNQSKNSVLNPKSPICPTEIPLLHPDDDNDHNEPKAKKFYTCSSNRYHSSSYVADTPNRPCPSCSSRMNTEMTFVSTDPEATNTVAGRGFVKDVVSYMVMDNLEVRAMSTISCITLINKFNVKDLGSLEERIVDFGLNESLKLLKASMESKNALTSVFLGKMEA